MKTIYILALFFGSTLLVAQNIEVSGGNSFCNEIDGTYTKSADVNERPSYVFDNWRVQWTGSRWELFYAGASGTSYELVFYNTVDTPTPPASSLSAWKPRVTGANGCGTSETQIVTVSGVGAATTLSSETLAITKNKLRIYPNPATERITISGLKNKERFGIYNLLGAEMLTGALIDNGEIEIKRFSNGLYFLKLDNGTTLKFIKE